VGRFVVGVLAGALLAAIAFEVVLHAANLKVISDDPGSNITSYNLVDNASADSGTSDWGAGHGKLSAVPSNKPGVVGNTVFKLVSTDPTKTASAYSPQVAVSPGEKLTASALVVSVPSGLVRVSVDWKTADGTYITSSPPGTAVTSPDQRAPVSAQAPNHARLATILVNLLGPKPGGSVEFDAVVAEKAAG
jgi:hypothetical protein